MLHGTEVGLGPGDIVLDGGPTSLPPKRGTTPNFRSMSIVAKRSPISAAAELLSAQLITTRYRKLAAGDFNCTLRMKFIFTFLRSVFAASRVHDILEMSFKFALRPRHGWKYGRHPVSDR